MKVIIAESELEKDQAFEIRRKVFVDEQKVPFDIEMDEYDDDSIHFVGYNLQQPIAAARLRKIENGLGKVERVSVLPEFRGQRVGVMMMEAMERHALSAGMSRLKLNSQSYAIPFYEKLNYSVTSAEFMDAGIPHRTMEKDLHA